MKLLCTDESATHVGESECTFPAVLANPLIAAARVKKGRNPLHQ